MWPGDKLSMDASSYCMLLQHFRLNFEHWHNTHYVWDYCYCSSFHESPSLSYVFDFLNSKSIFQESAVLDLYNIHKNNYSGAQKVRINCQKWCLYDIEIYLNNCVCTTLTEDFLNICRTIHFLQVPDIFLHFKFRFDFIFLFVITSMFLNTETLESGLWLLVINISNKITRFISVSSV